jgi:hypothetical protein
MGSWRVSKASVPVAAGEGPENVAQRELARRTGDHKGKKWEAEE